MDVVKYVAKDGQEMTLTPELVKKYLVSGNRDQVTTQEIVFFLGICKSRGLNPFKKDCYLVKYGTDPAAIITSIDYFRSRAKAQPDCHGWKKGIIVQNKETGRLRDSAGLILENEILLGGFFEAKPSEWDEPFRLEVNLGGYIKKTKDGRITKFWQPENQPTQIAKVAESQGLRTLWSDEFQHMYVASEIPGADGFTVNIESTTQSNERVLPSMVDAFFTTIPEGTDANQLHRFLELCAEQYKSTVDKVKEEAVKNQNAFWSQFRHWSSAQPEQSKETNEPATEDDAQPRKQSQYEFTNKTGMLLAKFDNLRDAGIREFWAKNSANFSTWPDSVKEIVKEKFQRQPDWAALLPEDEESPQPDITLEKPGLDFANRLLACPRMNGDRIAAPRCQNPAGDGKPCPEREGCPEWDKYDKHLARIGRADNHA